MQLFLRSSSLGGNPALAMEHSVVGGNSQLVLNGENHFEEGVRIARSALLVKEDSLDGTVSVVVGNVTTAGSLRSVGSVRAAKGIPTSMDDSLDRGFAFDEDGDTGLFSSHSGLCVVQ